MGPPEGFSTVEASEATLFLIRHPETTWNILARYQGRLESPLSERGGDQMQRLLDLVTPGSIDAVYSSPLGRARFAAEAIAARAEAPITVDNRLTEIDMGSWQGLYRHEIEAQFPDLFHTWNSRPDYVTFPGGESLFQVMARTRDALDAAFCTHSGERVAVVAHHAVLKSAIMHALGLPLSNYQRFHLHNASISVLTGSSLRQRIHAINITDHLTGSPLRLAG